MIRQNFISPLVKGLWFSNKSHYCIPLYDLVKLFLCNHVTTPNLHIFKYESTTITKFWQQIHLFEKTALDTLFQDLLWGLLRGSVNMVSLHYLQLVMRDGHGTSFHIFICGGLKSPNLGSKYSFWIIVQTSLLYTGWWSNDRVATWL